MMTAHHNKFFIFILVTAFISLQWSSTHIHLAENHVHDGAIHQHEPETHNHDLASHHPDVIDKNSDFSNQHNDNVVELEPIYASSHVKVQGQFAFLPGKVSLVSNAIFESIGTHQSLIIFSHSGFLERSSILPRAPPRYS